MNNEISIPDTPEPLVMEALPYVVTPRDSDVSVEDAILANQVVLNQNIATIAATMNLTMVTIDRIATEVQPMVESLTKSPILKMFGGK